jgi:hypothetical protein
LTSAQHVPRSTPYHLKIVLGVTEAVAPVLAVDLNFTPWLKLSHDIAEISMSYGFAARRASSCAMFLTIGFAVAAKHIRHLNSYAGFAAALRKA